MRRSRWRRCRAASGVGCRSRCSSGSPPNFLILDEPTNHLDLESREALEEALAAFPGSLLLVSHDRALLDAVGSRTIELRDRELHAYVGGWPEYLRVRAERAAKPPAPKKADAAVGRTAKPRASAPSKAKPAAGGRGGARRAPSGWRSRSSPRRRRWPRSRTSSPTRRRGRPRGDGALDRAPRGGQERVAELYERYETVAG